MKKFLFLLLACAGIMAGCDKSNTPEGGGTNPAPTPKANLSVTPVSIVYDATSTTSGIVTVNGGGTNATHGTLDGQTVVLPFSTVSEMLMEDKKYTLIVFDSKGASDTKSLTVNVSMHQTIEFLCKYGPWKLVKIERYVAENWNDEGPIRACIADNATHFYPNKTCITKNGAIQCDAGETESLLAPWSISSDYTKLTWGQTSTLSVTATMMQLTIIVPSVPGPGTVMMRQTYMH